jgi:hypothetical protein
VPLALIIKYYSIDESPRDELLFALDGNPKHNSAGILFY